jgi:hypothetical protein
MFVEEFDFFLTIGGIIEPHKDIEHNGKHIGYVKLLCAYCGSNKSD